TFNFQFSSSMIDHQNTHHKITKELLNDGIITAWNRIITFISFSVILAEYLIQEKQQEQNMSLVISSIID
ncbi:unnamed protein product, partial [Rotaria sp. Silwood2]